MSNTQLQQGIFILYLVHLGFSVVEISVLQALLFVSTSLASVPVGLLVDRIGARAAAGLAQLVIATVLFAQVLGPSTFWFFMLLFMCHGIGLTFRDNSEVVILFETAQRSGQSADLAFPVLRSRCTAIRAATVALAIIVGGFIQPVSWTLVYVISGTAAAVAGLTSRLLLPTTPSAAIESADDTKPAATESRWRVVKAMGAGWALLVILSSLMHGTLTPYLIFSQNILQDQEVSTPAIAITMAGVYVVGIVAPLLAPRAMRRFPVLVLAGSTLTLLTAGLIVTSAGVGPVTIVVVLIVASVPEVTAIALDFAIQDRMPSHRRGTVTGVVTSLESTVIAAAYVAFGAASVTLGASASAGAFAALPFAALLILLGAWVLRPRPNRSLNPEEQREETVHHDGVGKSQL